MKTDKVRSIIALSIVTTTCIVMLTLTLLHAVTGPNEGSYTDMMKTWGTAMSGTLGTILGYYFGKTD